MLRDLRLLKQLQKDNVSLCPIETLTRPHPPVWTALVSLLPFDEGQTFTFVLNEQRGEGKQLQGFIQIREPSTQSGMYLQCITPRLEADEDAQSVWNRLLSHVIAMAGERGTQRVFAYAGDESPELTALLGTGFSLYTREDIYRLDPGTHPQMLAPREIRAEQSTDSWQLGQLYRAITPHLVQQAESRGHTANIEWSCEPMIWNQGEGFVLDDREGTAGYGHLISGHVGHWLNILIHPRAYDQAGDLIDYALALLNYYPPRPVYCAVREYQGGVRVPLETRGFDLFSAQCCLVRHTMGRVKEPARGLVPALEKRVEAPTTTVSSSEGAQICIVARD
jgi:hypothetical protein